MSAARVRVRALYHHGSLTLRVSVVRAIVLPSAVPWMVRVFRPAIIIAPMPIGVAELLCCPLPVVLVTQVAGVIVGVGAAKGERHDVVHHGSDDRPAFSKAILTEVVCAAQATVTLGNTSSATQTRHQFRWLHSFVSTSLFL